MRRYAAKISSGRAVADTALAAPLCTDALVNPVYLYQDALVGIIPERGLNNGQPWLHAMLIAAAAQPGEHVVNIGAGGYYTAILAHMVGERGWLAAIEFDDGLAERVAANFAAQPNVRAL